MISNDRAPLIAEIERSLSFGNKVAVIGAGTMGCGIAAHLANLGFEVQLFDTSREAALAGIEKAKAIKPPHFTTLHSVSKIQPASIEEDILRITECFWVCEAIVEKIEYKRDLFAKIEPYLRPETIITTNTSGLELALLSDGRGDDFKTKFLGTHFFNPPRYLKLLEVVPTEKTLPEVTRLMIHFLETRVAKRVVVAKDTPGFITNRYGMWSMYKAIHVAEQLGLSVEDTDAITGPFLGRPRSGSFRLNDLVGLDVMEDIACNLRERCPSDPFIADLATPKSMLHLAEKGWIGEKNGQGYYRRNGKEIFAYDFLTQAYRERKPSELPTLVELAREPLNVRLSEAIRRRDVVAEFLRLYLHPALSYAQYLAPEISHGYIDFDRAMEWGFGWEAGPFAMIDMIGGDSFGAVPKYFVGHTQRSFSPPDLLPIDTDPEYRAFKDFPLLDTRSTFNIRDLGDDVHGLGITTKMGVITPGLIDEMRGYIVEHPGQNFVLTTESKAFSVGFDLRFFEQALKINDLDGIDSALEQFHRFGELLERTRIVAAVFGYCIGGGLEVAMSCPKIVSTLETQIGLPEAKVGLIPGGRGNALMRLRSQDSAQQLVASALNLAQGSIATNADESKNSNFLRDCDVTCYSADSLIATAKREVLKLTSDDLLPASKREWKQVVGPVVGMIDQGQNQLKSKGDFSDYDEVIGDHLKTIFAKTNSYEEALTQERALFIDLCKHGLTVARIKHMLEFSKPLRN